jgi:hypothetical protein
MWLMVFGTAAGTWNRYLPNISRSTEWRPVRFVWQLLNCGPWRDMGGGVAVFIFNILVGLSGQLRAPAALATGKYSPVDLSCERRLCGFTGESGRFPEEVNMLLLTGNKRRSPDFIPWLVCILRLSCHTLWGTVGNRHASGKQSSSFNVGRLLVSVRLATVRYESLYFTKHLTTPFTVSLLCCTKTSQQPKS